MDVRGAPGILMVLPGIGAGPDRDEFIPTLVVRYHAPCPGKIWIERRVMLIVDVDVTSGGICLPDLDQRVRHRAAVLVEHPARDDDALPDRRALVLRREITVAGLHHLVPISRRGQLGLRMPQ